VDDDERGVVTTAKAVTGTYSISNAVGGVTYNGYGNLTITPPTPLVFVSTMGIYMTDPALNLTDPNNNTFGGQELFPRSGVISEFDYVGFVRLVR
jgi:hypothetical protein